MRRTLLVTCALLLAACGGAEPSADGPFIALSRDFEGFESWEAFSLPDTGGTGHQAGARTIFLNQRPPPGSTSFPVGTILVKRTDGATPGTEAAHLLAMVKRGRSYNLDGAVGWEWFELEQTANGLAILWRGVGPPTGTTYGDSADTCNVCHAQARSNDFVTSAPLRLDAL